MTDMTAFERQVAGEMLGRAGPVRPVDDLAVFESVTVASRSRRWEFTMFSALKFVVAAAIVALFGGFLLAGILNTQQGDEVAPAAVTESPSPMATDELLSGMVTEEVEPGVYRIRNDGVRGLATKGPNDRVAAAPDGSVWLARPTVFFRLGDPTQHEWWTDTVYSGDLQVAPDGKVWTRVWEGEPSDASTHGLRSYDGTEWTRHEPSSGLSTGWNGPTSVYRHHIGADGAVWAQWSEPGSDTVLTGALGPDDREPPLDIVATGDDPDEVLLTDAGPIAWEALREDLVADTPMPREWERPKGLPRVAVAMDGTVWAIVRRAWEDSGDSLIRLADGVREEWTAADGLPSLPLGEPHIAPDGSLWTAVEDDGVGHFDGSEWSHYLSGRFIRSMDVGPDGSVWMRASESASETERPEFNLYVITPEAVAAQEAQAEASASPDATTVPPMPMPELGDSDSAPTYFEGSADWTSHFYRCVSFGNPPTGFCGGEFRGSMEATDSRLDGHVAVNWSGASGAVRIENERGIWSGALGAGGDVPMVDASRFGAWLVGEDAYEGLNAFMHATLVASEGGYISQQWTVEGWVFDEVPWPEPLPEEQ